MAEKSFGTYMVGTVYLLATIVAVVVLIGYILHVGFHSYTQPSLVVWLMVASAIAIFACCLLGIIAYFFLCEGPWARKALEVINWLVVLGTLGMGAGFTFLISYALYSGAMHDSWWFWMLLTWIPFVVTLWFGYLLTSDRRKRHRLAHA